MPLKTGLVAAAAVVALVSWLAPRAGAIDARASAETRAAASTETRVGLAAPTLAPVPAGGWRETLSSIASPMAGWIAAIESLGQRGSTEALQRLADMLGEANPALAAVCTSALATPLSRWSLLEALHDPDPRIALAAAQALAAAPGPDAVSALSEAVRNGDAGIRPTALQALLGTGAVQGLELARSALEGTDLPLAKAAAEALLNAPSAPARELLRAAAASADPAQRAAAAQALAQGGGGSPEWLPTMLALATDPEPAVRQPTLSALSQIGSAEAAAPVLDAARAGAPADRALALELLGNMPDERAGTLISSLLTDADPQVALAALRAARYRLGTEADTAIAARFLEPGAAPELRLAAALALSQHGGPASVSLMSQIGPLLSAEPAEP